MDGERIVGVLIGMHGQGQLTVLLLDVTNSRVVCYVKNLEWVKRLQRLKGDHHSSVEVPDVP